MEVCIMNVNINEMNEAIALFDGWQPNYGGAGSPYYSKATDFIPRFAMVVDMQYHTSWDWLMPVIKKIKGMHMDILKQAYILDYMKAAGAMNSGWISLDIDKAHKGVYEFLIWHNQQKAKV